MMLNWNTFSQNTLTNFQNNQQSRFKVLLVKIFSVFLFPSVLVLTFNCFQMEPQTISYHFHTDCLKCVVQKEDGWVFFFQEAPEKNHMLLTS